MNDPSVPSPRARETRRNLLEAGERVLAARGFEALTSTAVAAEAGVSTGTFYAYLPDKHALLAALFAASLDALVEGQEQVLTADALLDDGLDATIRRAVERCVCGFRQQGPVLRAALARISVDEALRRIYWERHERALEVTAAFLRRGAAAGMIRGDEPDARARALVVLLQGLNHPALLADDEGALRARAVCVDALVGLLEA